MNRSCSVILVTALCCIQSAWSGDYFNIVSSRAKLQHRQAWQRPAFVPATSKALLTEIRGGGGDDYYRGDSSGFPSSDSYNGGGYNDDSRYDDDRYHERDYDDRGSARGRGGRSSPSIPNVSNIIKNGDRRIGFALLTSGAVFTIMGISLFFNKSLMRLGNLLFIAGVPMTIGPGRTAGYFLQPAKARATGCLALGIFLVFIGSPVFGIILEIFGLLNLFGNMFPMVTAIMKQLPIFKTIMGNSNNNRRSRRRDDDYHRRDDDNDGPDGGAGPGGYSSRDNDSYREYGGGGYNSNDSYQREERGGAEQFY